MPAVLRAGLGLRLRRPVDPGRARRRRVDRQRPEGVDDAGPHRPSGACSSPAPTPTCPSTAGSRPSSSTCRRPGVEVRPLRQMTGEAEFNEVYFTDVRIPDSERLGDAGRRLAGVAHDAHERAGVDRRHHRAPGLGPDRPGREALEGPAGRAQGPGRRKDELMKLWIEAEVQPAHQHPGRRRTARWARRGRRARPASWPSPSRTRGSTSFCVDLMGADGMLYGSYDMVRPDDGDGRRHASRRRSCAAGPTRSRAARRRSCATSSASGCSACRATSGSTARSPGARSPATDAAAAVSNSARTRTPCGPRHGRRRDARARAASTSLARGPVVDAGALGQRAAQHHGGGDLDRGLQVADVAGRREVLVLVGDAHLLARRRRGARRAMHGLDQLLGRRRAGRDADGAGEVAGQLVDVVDAVAPAGTRPRRPASRGPRVFDELAEPMTTMASHWAAIAMSADWRLVVAKHRSLRPGVHTSGKRSWVGVEHAGPVAVRQRRLGQQGDRLGRTSGRASTSATDSTRWMASGATAIVPTASSWPSWPT